MLRDQPNHFADWNTGQMKSQHIAIRHLIVGAVVAAILACVGCGNRPGRVTPPGVDSQSAGKAAVNEYDRDSDGLLSEAELKQCPPLLVKRVEIDANRDGNISAEEIAARISAWQQTKVGFVTGYKCKVLQNGKPFQGAVVELVPEDFLGDAIRPASGTVDAAAVASLAIANADLPDDLRGLRGVQFGLYRVRITHPTKSVPMRFNKTTELGCEIYPLGDPEMLTYSVATE